MSSYTDYTASHDIMTE